jgi:beta-carotene/zeaxanthin 4-ketolase
MTQRPLPDFASDDPVDLEHQRRIGLALAVSIVAAWLALHVGLVFFFPLSRAKAPLAVPLPLVQTWLYVGLFIIAHDYMHGSLVPFRPATNRWIGQVCLFFYVGFSFDALNQTHHRHHRYAGTAEDPDFNDQPPFAFWPWFAKFFLEYFSVRQMALIGAAYLLYVPVFGASPGNALVFWALPGILSALQLFTFGTYLPHRPGPGPFADRHKARSNAFPPWLSLLTCFHFGYHHEHHLYPAVPWWRLPRMRAKSRQ